MNMSKKIALVGHCGPDSSYLRMTVMKAAGSGVQILMADDDSDLNKALAQGVDLILFNRELGYGFQDKMGVDAIKRLRTTHPNLKTMLVSNYAEAQAAAVANGALPGFGKREIGSPRVIEVIKGALESGASVSARQ
ncbi:MAG: response regulator receiver protein [Phycisphaerales bacterium]|nr:response regulator receiver protein [Phycisphaerales bacterium]